MSGTGKTETHLAGSLRTHAVSFAFQKLNQINDLVQMQVNDLRSDRHVLRHLDLQLIFIPIKLLRFSDNFCEFVNLFEPSSKNFEPIPKFITKVLSPWDRVM